MSFETALSARLLADADVLGATGGRVDWMRRPGRALPAVTLQIVSDPRPQHMTGFERVRATQVQIDVWAARPGEAGVLRDRIIAVLAPGAVSEGVRFQRAMVPNVRPGFETDEAGSDAQPAGELYRESIDFIFTHNAT
jgi:hypothetical protein